MKRQLFELQQVDDKIAGFKRERSKLDDGAAARAELETLHQALEQETAELNRLNTDRSGQELQLQTAEDKIKRQQNRLMTAKSAHEVGALQRDIEALTRTRGDLDEAILMLMEEADSCAGRLKHLREQHEIKGAETSGIETHFAAETKRLEAALDAALREREQIAMQLSAEEIEKYGDSARRHHGVAVAHSEGGNCSACGTALTPFNLKEARSREWPTCESCNRLLWIES